MCVAPIVIKSKLVGTYIYYAAWNLKMNINAILFNNINVVSYTHPRDDLRTLRTKHPAGSTYLQSVSQVLTNRALDCITLLWTYCLCVLRVFLCVLGSWVVIEQSNGTGISTFLTFSLWLTIFVSTLNAHCNYVRRFIHLIIVGLWILRHRYLLILKFMLLCFH